MSIAHYCLENLVIVMMCFVMFTITLSALFTGLNLGIMSLEVDHLEVSRKAFYIYRKIFPDQPEAKEG